MRATAELSQPKPEFIPPKEGWLERVGRDSFWDEKPPLKNVEAVLDKNEAVAFVANFFAAGIVSNCEKFEDPVPLKGSGELERTVVSRLGRMVNEVLRGEEYVNHHDVWDISIERTGNEYTVTIFGNLATAKDAKTAYERSLKEELIDFELIKEWDLGPLYEKLKKRKADH